MHGLYFKYRTSNTGSLKINGFKCENSYKYSKISNIFKNYKRLTEIRIASSVDSDINYV
jgi:hypothetical protein